MKNCVKIGIVGMGQRVCFHGGCVFKDCKDDIKLAAICDNRPERLDYAKNVYEQEFGYEIKAYENYEKMYAEAGLDGVYIAGPNYLHKDMTLAAFARDIHVLCEKPMEVTLKKCDEMISAAGKSCKILAMCMQMHYRKRYHKVKELIESGAVGKAAMVWCTEYRGPFIEMKDWVWDKKKSGGAIVEKNCHHYDILNMWVQSNPTMVYATGNIMKHFAMSGTKSEIIDNAWIVNDYENGIRAMVGICFLGTDKGHHREFGVQGTEGKIYFSSNDGEMIHVVYNNGQKEDYDYRNYEDIRGGVFKDFVECVRAGHEPLVTGEMARESLLIPLAAEKSIEQKRVVNVVEI